MCDLWGWIVTGAVIGRLPGNHGHPRQPGQRLSDATFDHSHMRGTTMKKCVLGGIVLVLVTCGWSTKSIGEQMPAPRGELHVVDKSPVNWQYIVLNIFEHLVEFSKDGTLVPRLATGWRLL